MKDLLDLKDLTIHDEKPISDEHSIPSGIQFKYSSNTYQKDKLLSGIAYKCPRRGALEYLILDTRRDYNGQRESKSPSTFWSDTALPPHESRQANRIKLF